MMNVGDAGFIRLLLRSPDDGDGWRNLSSACRPLIDAFTRKELLEIDAECQRVRLSEKGRRLLGVACDPIQVAALVEASQGIRAFAYDAAKLTTSAEGRLKAFDAAIDPFINLKG